MFNKSNQKLLAISLLGIFLTTIYTAILATQLMSTKQKVNFLYYKDKFSENTH